MSNLHVSVTLAHRSGLTRDQVVNTFAIKTADAVSSGDLATIATALGNFYTVHGSGMGAALSNYLGDQLSRSVAPVMRTYDVTGHEGGTPSGSPIDLRTLPNLGAMGGSFPVPPQLAAVLSFHSDYGTDEEFGVHERPRSRDRGRVYIGPLSFSSFDQDATTKDMFLSASIKTDLTNAANNLATDLGATIEWCTWSRKAARFSPVVAAWVDNVVDTQRRREQRPTSKTLIGLP